MEKLSLKYEFAKNSLESLNRAILNLEIKTKNLPIEFENYKHNEELLTIQDSLIQRFEYSVDTLWKYLKEYLWQNYGVEQNHPKSIFRECFKANLITEVEAETFISMVDDPNMTSHAYNAIVANKISKRIPKYYTIMYNLINKIAPK